MEADAEPALEVNVAASSEAAMMICDFCAIEIEL
jgi:hypothetical protein